MTPQDYPQLETGIDLNALLTNLPMLLDMHHGVHESEADPEDSLFLQLTEDEVALVQLGLMMSAIAFACLEVEASDLLEKISQAIETQKEM